MIRDLLTVKLIKGPLNISELKKEVMNVAGCDFTVLKPILETVAHANKDGVYELKSLDKEVTESLEFTPELLALNKTRTKQMENLANKAKKSDFLKTGQEVKQGKASATKE